MPWKVEPFTQSLTSSSPHTRRAYEHDVSEFVTWAERGGCAEPERLDHRVLRRYLAYLTTRGLSRATISRKAASVRAYARFLRRHGVIATDPGRFLQTPKGGRRLPRVPSSQETNDLLDHATISMRDAAVLELLYGAGLRVSECCGLREVDVDQRRRTVTVLGKGSKIRRLPLGELGPPSVVTPRTLRPPGHEAPVSGLQSAERGRRVRWRRVEPAPQHARAGRQRPRGEHPARDGQS